jgi:molybdopterin converting factor subunit 1
MKVKVRLFARARDLAGAGELEIVVPEGATVADLRRVVARQEPALRPLLERSALAINTEFAEDSAVVPTHAEIALLPPVSGG